MIPNFYLINHISLLDGTEFPEYLVRKVRHKALDSSNAYIRYLAAKKCKFYSIEKEEEKAIKARIEMDPEPLVKYCLLENEWGFLDKAFKNPELFFNLPHEARLSKVRMLEGSGEDIASLIAYAVDNYLKQGQVKEIELYDILADYLNSPLFRKFYGKNRIHSDGWGEFQIGKDINALWALIVKVPEGISRVLIEHLPEQAGLSSGIPENILERLTPGQLETLLYRRDIVLKELRRKIFKNRADRLDSVRSAAISSNFDISYNEFAEILAKPDNEKIEILREFSVGAGDLSLVFYDALHDILSAVDVSLSGAWENVGMAKIAFERKAKGLTGWQRKKQLRELRLYRLARQTVPWKPTEEECSPGGQLEFLANLSVDGDTWATFKNFSNEWANRRNTERLEKYLPRIYEVEGEDIEEAFSDDIDSAHPRMALLRDFCVGRSIGILEIAKLFLRFQSSARLELTQNCRSWDGH